MLVQLYNISSTWVLKSLASCDSALRYRLTMSPTARATQCHPGSSSLQPSPVCSHAS